MRKRMNLPVEEVEGTDKDESAFSARERALTLCTHILDNRACSPEPEGYMPGKSLKLEL